MRYLTGFLEPQSCLLLEKNGGQIKATLFCRDNNPHELLWSGPVTGPRRCIEQFGVDEAIPYEQLEERLAGMLSKPSDFEYLAALDENVELNDNLRDLVSDWADLTPTLQAMRAVKRPAELAVMREAGRVAAEAMRETIHWSPSTRSEAALAAKMEFECRLRGAAGLAYVPVVAGGDRSLILHYIRNDRVISEGDLLLMDAGAHYHGYCSDISRTWPISKRFTAAQRQLYLAVLRVQEACIQAAGQAHRRQWSLVDLNGLANSLMRDELAALGFNQPAKHVDRLFPHSIGHLLGMDLHDCPQVSPYAPLKEGTVITIEPGLYIPRSPEYPAQYHGIGIRIEDDLIIGSDSVEILTAEVPKHPDHLEQLLN